MAQLQTTAITGSVSASAEITAVSFTSSRATGVGFFGTASFALTASGATGTSGTSGTAGSAGTSGSSGTSGSTGSSGSAGTAGSSGTSGTRGSSGSSGTSGANGSSGSSGATGGSGSSGSSGATGANGSSGSSGTSASVTINNNTDNYLVTATGTTNTLNGEANLTFDGTSLTLGTGNVTVASGKGLHYDATNYYIHPFNSTYGGTYIVSAFNSTIVADFDGTGTTEYFQVRAGAGTPNVLKLLSKTSGAGVNNSALTLNDNVILNAANYSSYALPLSGGTMSGDVTVTRIRGVNSLVLNTYTTVNPSSNVYLYSQPNDRDAWIFLDSADVGSNWGIYHRQIDSAVSGLPANSIGFIGGGSSALQAYISLANGSANFAGALTQAGNQVVHAGNVSSYALPIGGGTLTGQLTIGATGTANSPTLRVNTSTSSTFVHPFEGIAANLTAGQHSIIVTGKAGSTKNSGYFGYYWAGDGSNDNFVTIGHWGNDDLFRVYGNGTVRVDNSLLVLDSAAIGSTSVYNTLALSGTLGINGVTNSSTNKMYDAYVDGNSSYFQVPQARVRLDSSATGAIDQAPVSLFLHNENGTNNTWVKLSMGGRETPTAGNTVSWAGIAARKISGTNGAWATGELHLWTKNNASISTGLIINSAGSVGVGTSSPTERFQVNGSARLGYNGTAFEVSNDSDPYTRIGSSIVGSASDARLNIQDRANYYIAFYVGATLKARLSVGGGNDLGFEVGGSDRLRILSDGKIGIGTTAPGYLFDVRGGPIYQRQTTSGTGIQWHIQSWIGRYDAVQTAGQYPNYLPGAAYGFHATADSDACFFGLITRGSSSNDYNTVIAWGDDGGDILQFRFNNGTIGELTDGGIFRVSNDIVAYYSFSDARLKTNVKSLDSKSSLNKILQLQGVEYEWKDGVRTGKKEIGFVAQDVEPIVPEIVRETQRLNDETLYKQVDYEHLVALLTEAIKEQQQTILSLQNRIETLEKK